MLQLQNQILRMIAKGTPVSDTLSKLCAGIEVLEPGVVCTVATIDRSGLIHPLAGPSVPTSFGAAIEGLMIGPDAGSCRTAAYIRQPVLAIDIRIDPRWQRFRDLPLASGMRACWSWPVTGEDGAVIGVVAFYFREVREPRDSEQKTMAACVELCEIALRREERVADRERRANIDGLTGLPNRAAFDTALNGLPLDQPGSWALFVVDLDNLKTVNDTFGHQAGDALIRTAGHRIAEIMKPDVTFRIGGDEFAVIIQNPAALRDLDSYSSLILESVCATCDCAGNVLVPGATIGAAVINAPDASAESVYQNADFALYHAKESGRGGFVRYWPGIGTRITRRRETVENLSNALNDGRLEAHYQPIVCLETRQIEGLEALCRLRTPAGDLITATNFQDALSDAAAAKKLTSRMIEAVAQDVGAWRAAGIPVPHIALNVSLADFQNDELRRSLEEAFERASAPLQSVVLEISENVLLDEDNNRIAREIVQLRKIGVRISVDDFGTGQTSFTDLLRAPIDEIKIDGSITARILTEETSAAIAGGLVDIGAKLGISVVAEGIETMAQAECLQSMGCPLGQGFLFSPPADRLTINDILSHSRSSGWCCTLDIEGSHKAPKRHGMHR